MNVPYLTCILCRGRVPLPAGVELPDGLATVCDACWEGSAARAARKVEHGLISPVSSVARAGWDELRKIVHEGIAIENEADLTQANIELDRTLHAKSGPMSNSDG